MGLAERMDSQLDEVQPIGKYEPISSIKKIPPNAINSHATVRKLCDRGTDTESWMSLQNKSSNHVNELVYGVEKTVVGLERANADLRDDSR